MYKKSMYWLAVLLVSIVTFSSCKKDDEKEVTVKDKLVARWTGESITTTVTIGGVPLGTDTESFTDAYLKFNADGTYEGSSNDEGEIVFDDGTWKLQNNDTQIVIDQGTSDEMTFTIKTLTSNDLVVEFSEEEVEDGIPFKITGQIDFKK